MISPNFRTSLLSCLVVLTLGFGAANSLVAQDDAPPNVVQQGTIIVAEQDDSGDAPRVMAFSTLGGAEMPLMVASPGMGFGMGNAPMESLLMDQQIQGELELVDDQMEKIRQIQKEMQEEISKEVKGMSFNNGGFDPERLQSMQSMMRSIRSEGESRINDVLLPHQTQRLEQLRRHLRMKSQGNGDSLVNGELAEALDISEAQAERIKEKAAELEKELAAEIKKLQAEAKEELFKELTPAQQDKLKELLGDNFVYEQQNPRQRLRNRIRPGQDSEEKRD